MPLPCELTELTKAPSVSFVGMPSGQFSESEPSAELPSDLARLVRAVCLRYSCPESEIAEALECARHSPDAARESFEAMAVELGELRFENVRKM